MHTVSNSFAHLCISTSALSSSIMFIGTSSSLLLSSAANVALLSHCYLVAKFFNMESVVCHVLDEELVGKLVGLLEYTSHEQVLLKANYFFSLVFETH